MSRRLISLVVGVLSLMLLHPIAGCNKSSEEGAIKAAFEEMYRCWEDSDGHGAVAVVNDKTFEAYNRLVKLALDGKASTIKALPACEKYEIITMRAMGKREEIRKLDGKGYVAYAVSNGWYSSYDDEDSSFFMTIRNIHVNQNSAWAEVYFGPNKSSYAMTFEKENGAWKVDETSIFILYTHELKRIADEAQLSVDQLILRIVSIESGKKLTDAIWDSFQ